MLTSLGYQTTKVTVGLLEEMLNAVPAGSPGEALADHVREVAEQVLAMRPRVHRLAEAATDEQVLMAVIGLNEQLEAALLHNDQLVAAAAAATAVMQSRPAAGDQASANIR